MSFNQTDIQRHKMKGSAGEVRETRTHIRRMSVDVGLFLGQKGLQVKAGSKSPVELSPVRGSCKDGEGTRSSVERDKVENREETSESRCLKQSGGKKKGSKKLKRSFRLGSTEEEESGAEYLSMSALQASQIPPPRAKQGRFRRSLRNTLSEDASSFESGSMVSIVEIREKTSGLAGGKTEKKSKFASSFPRRQWSWRSKKTEFESELSSHDGYSHQRSASDVGEERRLSSTVSIKEESNISPNPKDEEFTSPTAIHGVVDSWESPAPSRAFVKHTSL